MSTIGIVANADSGRDIRRIVTGASVFDNSQKAAAIARLIAGCAVEGVGKVVVMPTAHSVLQPLARQLAQISRFSPVPLPALEVLDFAPRYDASDTLEATLRMIDLGCKAIAVLGGDGTHRIVAGACTCVPMLAMSSGTNNAFPYRYEETTAGRALGLVATGRVETAIACRQERMLRLTGEDWQEVALVDAALTRQRFSGSRAVWRTEDLREVLVVFSDPTVTGLSSVASAVRPCPRWGDEGLLIRLGSDAHEGTSVMAAIAPGLLSEFRVLDHHVFSLHTSFTWHAPVGSLALDGERTVEIRREQAVTVELAEGPLTIHPALCLAQHERIHPETSPGRAADVR
jgi:predicted polyphosphate/ATP-dependent NAD kinase